MRRRRPPPSLSPGKARSVSTLYRPRIVRYTLPGGSYRTPDGRRVTKDTPGAIRSLDRSPSWWGRYRDAAGVRHQARLSKNKQEAQRMLARLSAAADLARVVEAWPRLPEALRRAVLALLDAIPSPDP